MVKRIEIQLFPSDAQKEHLEKSFAAVQFVKEYFLKKDAEIKPKKLARHLRFRYYIKELPQLKKQYPFLQEVSSILLNNACAFAYEKDYENTLYYSGTYQYKKNAIKLPKLKWILTSEFTIDECMRSITIYKKDDEYFAIIKIGGFDYND